MDVTVLHVVNVDLVKNSLFRASTSEVRRIESEAECWNPDVPARLDGKIAFFSFKISCFFILRAGLSVNCFPNLSVHVSSEVNICFVLETYVLR